MMRTKPSPMNKDEALAQALKAVQTQLQALDAERLALRNAFKLLLRRLDMAQAVRADLLMLASVLESPDAEAPRQAIEGLAAELLALGGQP